MTPDSNLLAVAQDFANELADLLHQTVVSDPPIRAQVLGERVLVGAINEEGESVDLPLLIAGERRLDLRISFRCTYDYTGRFLAIEQSEFALLLPTVRHPVVRFDYVRARPWGSAHVQLHAESSAIGFLRAHAGKPSETWRLHLPVGGRRFRPSIEDVIEFVIREFAVEAQEGWQQRIDEGRRRWGRLQTQAAIRDAIKNDPHSATALRASIDAAVNAGSEEGDAGS